MAGQLMDWIAYPCIPNDSSFIERTCQDEIAVWIEMQRDQLTLMSFEGGVDFAHLDVP